MSSIVLLGHHPYIIQVEKSFLQNEGGYRDGLKHQKGHTHGGNTLTSAQCSTLSTSCYTSLKKSLSLEPLLYTRQITYTVSLFVGLTRTLTHLYQRHAQSGTLSLFQ